MAYTDAVNDVVRLVGAARFANGQVQEMSVHMLCTQTGGTDTRPQMCAWMDNLIVTNLLPHTANSTQYYGSQASLAFSTVKWVPVTTIVLQAGADTQVTLPSQCRPLISWKTGVAGRRFRGRTFSFTPGAGSLTTSGQFDVNLQNALKQVASTMIAGFLSTGSLWVPAVFHAKPTTDFPAHATLILSSAVGNRFATQRRGGPYGRVNANPW
jgi:hypothetical protein